LRLFISPPVYTGWFFFRFHAHRVVLGTCLACIHRFNRRLASIALWWGVKPSATTAPKGLDPKAKGIALGISCKPIPIKAQWAATRIGRLRNPRAKRTRLANASVWIRYGPLGLPSCIIATGPRAAPWAFEFCRVAAVGARAKSLVAGAMRAKARVYYSVHKKVRRIREQKRGREIAKTSP